MFEDYMEIKMIKILQFGEGNFLRTFAEPYFQTLNEEGGRYEVIAIKPRSGKLSDAFALQHNRYHVVLRGMENGRVSEQAKAIDVLKGVFSPSEEPEKFFSLARKEDLRLVISNTTESGIRFDETDRLGNLAEMTYPAKLTEFLYERYKAGRGGVYLLPTELIDDNAEELKRCVNKYIRLWNLPDGFSEWNERENYYCNTLVDRIVSGYPKEEETLRHLEDIIGGRDALMSVGEPYGLWAIEKKGEIEKYLKAGRHDIEVVLTENVNNYKKRKVRVLNGSHTNMVGVGLLSGKETVYDCMTDTRLNKFISQTLEEEILPYMAADVSEMKRYAESVKERFLNPYLNHRLESIALKSFSKWKTRLLPSVRAYYAAEGKVPRHLVSGFAALVFLAGRGKLPGAESVNGSLREFLRDTSVWGEDLTGYVGFFEGTKAALERIGRGEIPV